ncbi:MAG: hypothetical protein OXG56_08895 [Gammaproteobacteria bacterium]|nr:hypothetical protein [Gammaproteobacteria bacterium]
MAYWPKNVPGQETVCAFIELSKSLRYTTCTDGLVEDGFEKIAIYALNTKVKHVARQLSNGNWVSKVGQNIDIEHETVEILEGPVYGKVVQYLKRPISNELID